MCISCHCASVLSVPAALLHAYVHVSSPSISCRHRAAFPSRASGANNAAATARIGAAIASGDTRADVPCARGTYFRIAAAAAGAPAPDAATNAAAFAADANTADANAVADATDDTADAAHAATVYDAAASTAESCADRAAHEFPAKPNGFGSGPCTAYVRCARMATSVQHRREAQVRSAQGKSAHVKFGIVLCS